MEIKIPTEVVAHGSQDQGINIFAKLKRSSSWRGRFQQLTPMDVGATINLLHQANQLE